MRPRARSNRPSLEDSMITGMERNTLLCLIREQVWYPSSRGIMMSTNTMSGWWSAILARASNPSIAVNTSQPSFCSRVSAVRRMVLLSSITRTLRPWSLVLLPVTFSELLHNCLGPRHSSRPYAHAPRARAWRPGRLSRDWRRCAAAHAFHTSRLVSRASQPKGKRAPVLTYRYTPGYAMHVTFFEARSAAQVPGFTGADIFVPG